MQKFRFYKKARCYSGLVGFGSTAFTLSRSQTFTSAHKENDVNVVYQDSVNAVLPTHTHHE